MEGAGQTTQTASSAYNGSGIEDVAQEHLIDAALALDGPLNIMAIPAPVIDAVKEHLIDVPVDRSCSTERFTSQGAQR